MSTWQKAGARVRRKHIDAPAAATLAIAAACWAGVAVPATIPTGATFAVGATIEKGCLLSGNPAQTTGLVFGELSFGTFSALSAGVKTANAGSFGGSLALLRCTPNTTVQVTADAGLHADGTQRRLASGTGYFLRYDLVLLTTGNPPLTPGTMVGLALGDTATALPLRGSLTLPGAAPGPGLALGAGTYTDTVHVTVSW